jgi:hypothetical protein
MQKLAHLFRHFRPSDFLRWSIERHIIFRARILHDKDSLLHLDVLSPNKRCSHNIRKIRSPTVIDLKITNFKIYLI